MAREDMRMRVRRGLQGVGAVALARIASLEKRIKPDLVRAFESPVTSVAFSQRGRWLATGAEGLRIWTWED